MADDVEIESRFWKEMNAHPTLILAVQNKGDGHGQPMTAFFEDDRGPLWFFTTTDNGLVAALDFSDRATGYYAAKGHDLFAIIHGSLSVDRDRANIDRFWNSKVAAWYPGGRDDPKICMVRLDTAKAEIWRNASGVGAAIKRILGHDPKAEYAENVAKVTL